MLPALADNVQHCKIIMTKDTNVLNDILSHCLLSAVFVIYAVLSAGVGFYLGKTKTQKWIITWLIFDAFTRFVWEGAFLWISLQGNISEAKGPIAILWQEYAKADKRWGESDSTIVSLEILTVGVCGPLCLVLCYAIIKHKFYRHFVQITLCVCELYGGWMTYCPEWLSGNQNLQTDNFLYLWVYLIFFNVPWIVVPFFLLWNSWMDLRNLPLLDGETEVQKDVSTETFTTTSVTHKYNTRSKKKD